MNNKKIGDFVASRRKEKNLTQQELADKIAVTVQAVSKWECGKSLPDISILKPLCEILGISINELLNGEKIAEKDIAAKADEQLVNQLVNQKMAKVKDMIWKVCNLVMLLLIVPLYWYGRIADDKTVRGLFMALCGCIMLFCVFIISALGIAPMLLKTRGDPLTPKRDSAPSPR
jgi:transcriptional regulator with XRE-family HTH domain